MSAAPKIITGVPPNFEAIADKFDVRGKPIYFAYDNCIYNPCGIHIAPAILEHEKVHLKRQGGDPAGWWEIYLAEPKFRLAEELPAHQAEFLWWLEHKDAAVPIKGFRSLADYQLLHIAKRLSSPLYGSLIGIVDAKRLIRNGETGAAR